MVKNSNEKICASHILIPKNDPSGKLKDDKLKEFADKLDDAIVKDPKLLGAAAFKLSSCPSGQNNPALNQCINKINVKSEKTFQKRAEQCVMDYGGDLGCFTQKDVDPTFFDAASKLKVNEITTKPVKTEFGYHIIQRKPVK